MIPHRIDPSTRFCTRCGVAEEFFRKRPEVARRCLPPRRGLLLVSFPNGTNATTTRYVWPTPTITIPLEFRIVMLTNASRPPRKRTRKAWKGWR